MLYPPRLEERARQRLAESSTETQNSIEQIRQGNPLAAEPDENRLIERLQAKLQVSRREAVDRVRSINAIHDLQMIDMEAADGREAVWGGAAEFVGVAFLERGLAAARSVARVAYRNGRPQGTGFMVSDRLFLTNKHVLESAASTGNFCIEFDYEYDLLGAEKAKTRFAFDPATFYVSDEIEDLDYALVAVGPRLDGVCQLVDFGCCTLSDAKDKHALGELANIVQHPDGRRKEVVVRENRLVARLDFVLHYIADTEPGSSGSPVFNNEWQVIALHHWGGPWRQRVDEVGTRLPREINEGIRISSIVADLRERLPGLGAAEQALLQSVLTGRERAPGKPPPVTSAATIGPRIDPDGTAVWQIPVEIGLKIPGLAASALAVDQAPIATSREIESEAKKKAPSPKPLPLTTKRDGYDDGFLGTKVALPGLREWAGDVVKLLKVPRKPDKGRKDEHVLNYFNASIVMSESRRLAIFTAANCGRTNRGNTSRGSDVWFYDDRIAKEEQIGNYIYAGNEFDRGHLNRRDDLDWGPTATAARQSNDDTFFWTNCTPQHEGFNQSKKDGLWGALENYISTVTGSKLNFLIFNGPVLSEDDRVSKVDDSILIPSEFWKVVVVRRKEGAAKELSATAFVLDQSDLIVDLVEAFEFDEESIKIYQVSLSELEEKTGLDFGHLKEYEPEVPFGREAARTLVTRLEDVLV